MDVLTPQQQAELAFWKDLIARVGPEYYYAYRCSEYYEKTRYFPGWLEQAGPGIDVGCGCISVFEPSSKNLICVDALVNEYHKLANLLDPLSLGDGPRKLYFQMDNETISPFWNYVDWVACINMIDHTPNPAKVISEIRRVLKPGGTLYFEVNFEAGLAPPHYHVWSKLTVSTHLNPETGFQLKHSFIQSVPEHHQERFWGVYTRI